jgi:hypothetical protein
MIMANKRKENNDPKDPLEQIKEDIQRLRQMHDWQTLTLQRAEKCIEKLRPGPDA